MKKLFLFLALAFALIGKPYQAKDFSNLLKMRGFDDSLLKMHFTLYQGYVKNCNLVNELLGKLVQEGKARSYEFGALKRRFGWEFDGMRLHEYYFSNLGGDGKIFEHSLFDAIERDFGSMNKWHDDFVATGMIRGIGWVILYYDPVEKRLFNVWINEHDLGHLAGCELILVMDVWEHAYITQFGLDRRGYIRTFFQNVNWDLVAQRYEKATLSHSSNEQSPTIGRQPQQR